MARLRRPAVEEDDRAAHAAKLNRLRLRFCDESWTFEEVADMSDADVSRELERLDAERAARKASGGEA